MNIYDTQRTTLGILAIIGTSLMVQAQNGDLSRGGDVPPNDECTGAVVQDLGLGTTLTFTGDNTGANPIEGTVFLAVWEAFTLEECATIQIDHCMEGFEFGSFLNTITNTCPDIGEGLITATEINECSMIYHDRGPGTWYFPVLVDEEFTPIGNYSFSITAFECNPPYCLAFGGSQEHTGSLMEVSFGGMDHAEISTGMGYVDNTLLEEAFVGTGLANEIIITIDDTELQSDLSENAQLLVWIDFNLNGDFSDPGELVHISEDPFLGTVHVGTITIPNNAMLGTTRMRIRLHDRHDGSEYENEANNTSCGSSTFGQVQDFSVNVDLGTSAEGRERSSPVIYPNPGDGNFTLLAPDLSGPTQVAVFDVGGRVVSKKQLLLAQDEPIQLDLRSSVAPGGYLLQLTNGDHRTTLHLVIQ